MTQLRRDTADEKGRHSLRSMIESTTLVRVKSLQHLNKRHCPRRICFEVNKWTSSWSDQPYALCAQHYLRDRPFSVMFIGLMFL